MTHHVLYSVIHRNDEWHVMKEDGQPKGHFKSKSDAVDRGRELAMREEVGQLRIAKLDGSVQSEFTFGRDPRDVEGR
jgi:hypothetical protein